LINFGLNIEWEHKLTALKFGEPSRVFSRFKLLSQQFVQLAH